LLDEPDRAANGYKQYGVDHLVRLLRIRRLADLGIPLAQIDSMGGETSQPDDALRVIDAELAATIERLQKVRAELALILDHRTPTDLPAGFGEGFSQLSESDRALLLIYSRVFSESAMDDMREMSLDVNRRPVDDELENLTDDSTDEEREDIARRFAPYMKELQDSYPWLTVPGAEMPLGAVPTGKVVIESLVSMYNTAQLDVLQRAHRILSVDQDGNTP
jgi:DNA-binding transcriptional MerR regulator